MQTAVQDKDQRSANAGTYAKGSQEMEAFSQNAVETLFTQMNQAYPFLTASAIMDVGDWPGLID